MALLVKALVLLFLLLLVPLFSTTTPFSSGKGSECFQGAAMNPTSSYTSLPPQTQDGKIIWKMMRKLLMGGGEDTMLLDYDDTGPNPKHDPRKGGGGGGGRT